MKKYIGLGIGLMIITITLFCGLAYCQYRDYTESFNNRMNGLCERILEKYPDISSVEIIDILNSSKKEQKDFLMRYGIDVSRDTAILENETKLKRNLAICTIVGIIWGLIVIFAFAGVIMQHRKNVKLVTGYLEAINRGNYYFDMNEIGEGEMSILENEVYKTTIMLKESAEQSKNDKDRLKESLSDISHQLKTPLTSVLINLDNLQENSEMDSESRRKVTQNARRDALKMKRMVQQLLTLSRFDANVVAFDRKETKLSEFVSSAIEDVSALADLRDIQVLQEASEDMNSEILCDSYWETHAIGNILKNGVEHAKSFVRIRYSDCNLYKEVIIENDGPLISEQDRKNIFERYYQGEQSLNDSVGIGLALANAIVKQDGGYIIVEADEEKQLTRFVVRYL